MTTWKFMGSSYHEDFQGQPLRTPIQLWVLRFVAIQ